MLPYYVVDADDFYDRNPDWEALHTLKVGIPGFKITLFTVPGRCTMEFIRAAQTFDWIDLVPHGWNHRSTLEALHWKYHNAMQFLNDVESYGMTHGFRAPGWQLSIEARVALRDRGYWLADHLENSALWPSGLRTYTLDDPHKLHYHIGGKMENRISRARHMGFLLTLKDAQFRFVKDCLNPPTK